MFRLKNSEGSAIQFNEISIESASNPQLVSNVMQSLDNGNYYLSKVYKIIC